MTSLSIYVDNRAEHIFIDGLKSNIYLNTNSISDRHWMEPTNRDARMNICRWSRKSNDGDVAMHVWSYSPDTRWTHDENKQTTWRRMISKWTTKIETQEEAPKGNLSKWREWLHKRPNNWNTEQRSRHFSVEQHMEEQGRTITFSNPSISQGDFVL